MLSTDAEGQLALRAVLQKKPGEELHLGRAIRLAGWPPMSNAKVLARCPAAVHLELFPEAREPSESSGAAVSKGPYGRTALRCKVVCQDSGEELAALRLLALLNDRWAREGLILSNVPVFCPLYAVEHLNFGLLLEEPPGVTLGELKRRCGEHTRTRVVDYLGREKLPLLAATCAANLAASYLLGASAGDGDTLRLLPDGALLRTGLCGLFGRGALLDAPPVWLPKAVTCALGARWPEVQRAALAAFEVALSALSPLPDLRRTVSWAKAQSLLLRIEHLLELPATEYLSGLSLGDLRAALAVADGTLGKRVSSVLHDFFGYCSVTSAALHETRTPEQEARARRLQLFVAAESQEAGASFLAIPWALGCRSWPLAVRIVACLSGDAERLLRLHCEDWLVACQAEALGDSAWFRSGALRSLATLVRHQGSEVCTWLADCCQPGGAMAPAEVAILARSLHGKVPSRDGPKETFLLELGAICALARLELRRTRGSDVALPETFADFAALVAQEAPAAKRCAAKAAAALLNSEEALEELAQMLRGTDLAAALRALDHLERFAAVRGLETAAKVRPSTCVMARQCLAALARDVEADISRPALCVIACAVHDDNEEVRQWARKFLTDASWTPPSSEGSSMCFFVGMVRNMVGSENVL